jgi:hypothetical protein
MRPTVTVRAPEGIDISDGYHSFADLYEHRWLLWIAFCSLHGGAWRSRVHSDGSTFAGWFVLGLGRIFGSQLTYHLPESAWDISGFAEELERAPEFDGHTPEQVMERLKAFVIERLAKPLAVEGP